MTTESKVLRSVLIRASKLGARLFRNNVGVLRDERGQHVAYGLCPGSADLIGFVPVIITPEMVGKRVALFLAVECKTDTGRLSETQRVWLASASAAGAVVCVARSDEDVAVALAPWLREASHAKSADRTDALPE